LPCPAASIMVEAPVTLSPPANIFTTEVCNVFSFTMMVPSFLRFNSFEKTVAEDCKPIASTTKSTSCKYSEPSIGIGFLRPLASAASNCIFTNFTCLTLPFSPINATGFLNKSSFTPSSSASSISGVKQGISLRLRR